MPLKRTQPPNFEASTKIFRTDRKTPTCLTIMRFGRLDGSKGQLCQRSAWGACFNCSISTDKLPDDAFKAERYSTGHDVPRLDDVLV
jgi:hypothetical protein